MLAALVGQYIAGDARAVQKVLVLYVRVLTTIMQEGSRAGHLVGHARPTAGVHRKMMTWRERTTLGY
jgi:hypothetical protein